MGIAAIVLKFSPLTLHQMSVIILPVQAHHEEPIMPLETGTIIAVAAALLFYLRLIVLQRQRGKQKTSSHAQPQAFFVIRNAALVGIGVLLIGLGGAMSVVPWFAPHGPVWWWAPVTLGILLMGLGVG
jgi:hypothetical protein